MHDFTFSPPKSVSLVGFLGNDERIFEAHARAVQAALKDFEAFRGGDSCSRWWRAKQATCWNFVAMNSPMTPHAPSTRICTLHCIVFNATLIFVENRRA